jgi:hypothetical protein
MRSGCSERGGRSCRRIEVPPVAARLAVVDLEEKTLERLGDRCEECGAKLTRAEIQAAMESGGPALCSIHAAEDEPGLAADEAGFDAGAAE